ncbi:Nonribosomal peptide synthetase 2 [Elsinoe australis]|uniref:Nonribosomal peptide synthetase 2 n=1 Tax=Elsinoe australis TaxID=40998 RepID=A0A2P7ZD71_9PEZI|nr:Nonribosomal peptide synthetase 2 [Elsinoe australis]
MPLVITLRGHLQVDTLVAALQSLEQRHETLRTTFEERDGFGVQIVRPSQPVNLQKKDASIADCESILREEQTKAFDLGSEPAWRLSLIRMGEDHHVLSIVMHHIISDGWSVDVLSQELSSLYTSAVRGQVAQLTPLPIQYRDFAIWQKQPEQLTEHKRQLEYWTKELHESVPAQLLSDFKRPAILSGHADSVPVDIDSRLCERIKAFGSSHQVTANMILLAAFRAAHYRMTGVQDATIGTPVANRERPEVQHLIGFFVNTQCMRITLGEDDSFESLIQRVKSTTTAAFANQDVPFENIVSSLLPGSSDTSRNPLVQMLFALHSQRNSGKIDMADLEAQFMPTGATTRFDVEFHLISEDEHISGKAVFATDLFERTSIVGFVDVFLEILRQGLQHTRTPIATLPLRALSRDTRYTHVPVENRSYPRDSSIIDVFRCEVEQHAETIAVKDSKGQLTYAQLDEQSNRVASWLHSRHFRPETPICILAPRSCETVIAIFGIMKAGLPYLPLDVRVPPSRIDAVLSELDCRKVMLLGADVPPPHLHDTEVKIIKINEILTSKDQGCIDTAVPPSATNLAYLMFTSGSTGKPKGVMIEHRAVVRLVKNSNIQDPIPSGSRMAHLTNIAFDISAWEIFAALLNGGTLICIDYLTAVDSTALQSVFEQERINVAILSPALLKQCIAVAPSMISNLHVLYSAGDRLDGRDAIAARKLLPAHVYNAYGPTEAGIQSTIYRVEEEDEFVNGVPVGRTVDNSGAYIMDLSQKVIPDGVMGELVVTGDGLARGYTDPELDTDRFVHVNVEGNVLRAYRTGDRARVRRRDGQIEFFGRMDRQIKIRGHRIELADVEHALLGQDRIQDAAVVVRVPDNEDPEIVGFATVKDEDTAMSDESKTQVETWSDHFEVSFYKGIDEVDESRVGNDFLGWNSMYDGSKIDLGEMQEWLDDTMKTLLGGRPAGHVLEIGSGTGMILFGLGAGLQSYIGLDPSASAVRYISDKIQAYPLLRGKIRVQVGTAADLDKLPQLKPDVVILNSVVQYFPSPEYLMDVIHCVVRLPTVKKIFFGDLRAYSLNRNFLASRAIRILGDRASKEAVRQKMAELNESEEELLIDPELFIALRHQLPDVVAHVEILPKMMQATNELSAYRYAAIIHVRQYQDWSASLHRAETWLDFEQTRMSRAYLTKLLEDSSGSANVAIANIPHSKSIEDRSIIEALVVEGENGLDAAEESNQIGTNWLAAARSKAYRWPCLSPTDITEIARDAGWQVTISWARQRSQHGALDAFFSKPSATGQDEQIMVDFPVDKQLNLDSMTNRPLHQQKKRQIEARIRDSLHTQLPAHMIPARITILDKMPLNPNSKVDRKALNERARIVPKSKARAARIAPRSDIEVSLCVEVEEVLGVPVGMGDNFFDLGGHSLMASKLAARLSRRLQTRVAVKDVFDHPTLSELAVVIAQGSASDKAIPQILDRTGPVKQSFAQGRLWFFSQLNIGSLWYMLPLALRLRGAVDIHALDAALRTLESRHETLRTTFQERHGVGVQIVHEARSTPIRIVDVPGKDVISLEAALKLEQTKPFDLSREPGWRVSLLRVSEDDYVLSMVMHHIVSDGWSIEILLRELRKFYSAGVRGSDPLSCVKKLPIQYRDFAIWQKQDPQLQEHARQLEYWKEQLRDSSPAQFLLARPRPESLSGQAGVITLSITGNTYHNLRALCRSIQVTPYVVLLAAFRATHYRMTGVEDATIGTVSANRKRPEVEDVIGFFVNTQCIRIKIEDETFESLVHQVRAVTAAAAEHQDVPFESLVSALLPGSRDTSRNPLVQVLFALHSQKDIRNFSLEGVNAELLQPTPMTRFDVEFHLAQGIDKFEGNVLYATDIFEEKTIQTTVNVFQEILRRGLDNPKERITSLPLTDGLVELNDQRLLGVVKASYPRDSSVVHCFREQASRTPDALAVQDSTSQLSYRELDRYSDRISEWLIRHPHLSAETKVGVFSHRSCQAIIAFFGILKAGMAYLPLDIHLPIARLRNILSTIRGKRLVLVGPETSDPDFGLENVELKRLGDIRDDPAEIHGPGSVSDPTATSLAYVMFTSGSTGIPKGVMVEHRSILRVVKAHSFQDSLPRPLVMAHLTNPAFDVSVFEICSAILNGGRLVCIDHSTILDSKALGAQILRDKINAAVFPPALLKECLAAGRSILSGLEIIFSSGDRLDSQDAVEANAIAAKGVFNAYGPTENGVQSTVYKVEKNESYANGVPIGRAVNDSGAFVMDDRQRLVGNGVLGELVLTGDGLARGYTDASMDADRFIRISLNGTEVRAYRTGDRVRHRPTDGLIEFFGRMDRQIKIRGHRVEMSDIEELGEFYGMVLQDQDPLKQVSPLSIQYRDFATWQRQSAQLEAQEQQLQYWKRQLADSVPAELPNDLPRPAVLSGKAGYVTFNIEGHVYSKLQSFCSHQQVTAFIVLLATFRNVHYRITGVEDATVGTPHANRNRTELDNVIGFFVNTQCIRIPVAKDNSFEALVQKVRRVVTEAQSNQDVPFEQLVSTLIPGSRDTSRNPLVQIMFSLNAQQDLGRIRLEGVEGEVIPTTPLTRFDIEFHFFHNGDKLAGNVLYSRDLFEHETIQGIVSMFEDILGLGLENPKIPLARMTLTSGLKSLEGMDLIDIQRTNYPQESSVVDVFREQVVTRAHSVAVKDTGASLTYADLDRLSDRLAIWLVHQSFPAEGLVAILAPRSCQTIATFIGVMKAKLAYVPLDINQPAARTEDILSGISGDCKLVLLGDGVSELEFTMSDMQQIRIKDILDSDSKRDRPKMTPQPSATNLAYVMFTSGSTGTPKGVLVEHRSILRLVKNSNVVAKLPAAPIVAHLSNIAFDASVLEIYSAILNGGMLVCVDYLSSLNSHLLGSIFEKEAVESATLSPALLKHILAHNATALEKMKLVYIGGDRLDPRDASEARAIIQGPLFNVYGPTENTVLSVVYEVQENEHFAGDVPIGVCVSNSGAYVMDVYQELVPLGVSGELVLTGDGLARGYSNPGLNEGRFIHVVIDGKVQKAYRTGDRARYRPSDKKLQFLGRMDQQIKIRGHRVELQEIEQVMLAHEEVRDAAAVTVTSTDGEELEIIAFITAADQTTSPDGRIDTNIVNSMSSPEVNLGTRIGSEVRDWLQAQLPAYMVPSRIGTVNQMPVNANGKVDRRKLAQIAPELPRHETTERVAPRTEAELAICEELADILGVQVSVNDNFFSLGGHSLMATKLAARIARRLDARVSVKDVFDHPIIAGLAETIRRGSLPHAPIARNASSLRVEQSFAQNRLWFLDRMNLGASWYNIPLAVRLRGSLDIKALTQALKDLEERHEPLRTVFDEVDGVAVQIVRQECSAKLKIIDIEESDNLDRILQAEQTTPFDLTSETGWRITLMRLEDDEYVLSLVMHHIISDGWSVDVLRRELARLYSARIRGQDGLSLLSTLPIQYRDFAVWQKEQKIEHQRQLEYWIGQLADSTPAELLTDLPRPSILSGQADAVEIRLEGSLYQDLRQFCRSQQTTSFAVLLAAFRATHYRLTGARDATIGTPVANRNRTELENMIGFFVNTQCMRLQLDETVSTFKTLVQQVKIVTAAAYENQDVPFEKLVSALQPGSRDTSRNPLVQLMFALHSQQNLGVIELEGLAGEIVPVTASTRFDFEIHLYQNGDRLVGSALYATDLFDRSTIQNIVDVFQEVLRRGIGQPDTPIDNIPITDGLSDLRTIGLLDTSTRTYSRDSSLIDIFCEQVQMYPDAIAVLDQSSQLTYSELNHKSSQLATWLRTKRLPAESLVGVLVTRSCETIVAFLGILKADLAYLPLDVNVPLVRIESILQEINGHKLVLYESDTTAPRLDLEAVELVRIRDTLRSQEPDDATNSGPSPLATSLAYVIFTSGSTGKPKGVMVEHRSIIRLVKESNVVHHLSKNPRIAHLSNIAFDAATWEIYGALMNGGAVVCIDYFTTIDTIALGALFTKHMVTATMLPPALLKQCIATIPWVLSKLDLLFVAGDRFSGRDAVEVRKLSRAAVFNAYGPTENTVLSTIYSLEYNEPFASGVPIGQTVTNSGAFVLNSNQELVSLGVMGELVVTGDGLARGYYDSSLNSGRFINIILDGRSVRAYRTGDRARYRPKTGQIEFHGRIDRQVKIRGHRVELTEVEQALCVQEAVGDAVVVPRQREGQELEMIAFVVSPASRSESESGGQDHVENWTTHFDISTYADISHAIDQGDIGQDFAGWKSMYDGNLIDKIEMQEWLDDTMDTLLDGRPAGNVLEIGTGTGMILFNLGDGLRDYIGLDPARTAVDFVTNILAKSPLATRARVIQGAATDVSQLRNCHANLVVINSVAQYFPSSQYLLDLIKSLAQLPDVERIFLGDIRTNAINRQFLAARALHELGERSTKDDIRKKIRKLEEEEEELLVEPALFTGLTKTWPDLIRHVEIIPKRMRATNELSSYRYAAVLHVHRPDQRSESLRIIDEDSWIDFEASRMDLDALRKDGGDSQAWVSEARRRSTINASLSPKDLETLARNAGWNIELSCARQRSCKGALDAVFHKGSPMIRDQRILFKFPTDDHGQATASLTNHPLWRSNKRRLEIQAHENLQTTVPSYMVPSQIVALDRIPLNANGKFDRVVLEKQAQILNREDLIEARVAPRNEIELSLCEEFADILGVASVGITDNFFDLGGHSLMATRLAARLRRRLDLQLSVKEVFDNPVLADLALVIQRSSAPQSPITRIEDSGPVDLSFAQSRLYFLDRINIAPSSYLVSMAMHLHGSLRVGCLSIALQALEKRHETLRTVFEDHDGVGMQVVRKSPCTELNIVVLGEHSDWSIALREEQTTSFDLTKSPGWRPTLFKLNAEHHILSLVLHHIISDGWSIDILRRELSQFYLLAVQHQVDPFLSIQPLPIQYRDFAIWQRREQEGEQSRQLEYWTNQLMNSTPGELLIDLPRPPVPSGTAGSVRLTIEGAVYHELRAFCRAYRVTSFVALLAVFRAAHYRLTGVEDANIGTPIANRDRPEVHDLIGFFVNTQCMRISVDDDDTLSTLVHRVRATSLAAFDNQDVPFERIVSKLLPGSRDTSRTPLTQLIFAVHAQQGLGQVKLEGLDVETIQSTPSTRFDVECHLFQEEDKLDGTIVFADDLFRLETIETLVDVFHKILRQGLEQPETARIAALPLTTGAADLTQEIPCNRLESSDLSIIEIFRQQVAAHAEDIAVKDQSTKLTYVQLDEMSDHIAQWLRSQDIAKESIIGILSPRSCQSVATYLGVLKANLAYLPLDIRTPTARIESILSAVTGRRLVLTGDDSLLHDLKVSNVGQIRITDVLRVNVPQPHHDFFASEPTATSLAYVIFTSGTTGRPKGVMIEHRGVVRLVKESNLVRFVPPRPIVSYMANTAFDMSIWEMYTALLNGGTLICIDYLSSLDSQALKDVFTRECINTAMMSPAMVKQCLMNSTATLRDLRLLYIGGDRLDGRDALAAKELVQGPVYNVYGPTENSVASTLYEIDAEDMFVHGVPIGRSISNSETYVMDKWQQVLPVGTMGELVVAGDGLARGYTDPSLEKGRFVQIIVKGQAIRAYRTGDHVRYRRDGQLEFFGRTDSQVKIRGNRVELADVEQAILGHGAVLDAAVITANIQGQDSLDLVGFFTTNSLAVISDENSNGSVSNLEPIMAGTKAADLERDVRNRLQTRLSPYMVPTLIVALHRLPLNANSKVDRQELARIAGSLSQRDESRTRVAPRNGMEILLAEDFTEILGMKVGVTDNFFDLGGHSLMAMKLAARVSRRTNAYISVKDIFDQPTIESLAEIIQQGSTMYTPIQPASHSGPVELSFAQGRLWFLDQLNKGASWYLMPLAMRLRGSLDVEALTTALQAIESRHEVLRTVFPEWDGVGVQVLQPERPRDRQLQVIEIVSDEQTEVDRALREQQTTPFILESEAGWRVALIKVGEKEYILSIVMHHIVSDGWSVDVLRQELGQFYALALANLDPLSQIEPLPIQYRDFAIWQRQSEQIAEHERQLEYWMSQLADSIPAEFLSDYPRPQILSGAAEYVNLAVDGPLYHELQAFCGRHQVTPFVILLAAMRMTHYRFTGAEDVVIGTPIANRNRPELEKLIGFFVNTQCIRINVTDDDSLETLVRQARSTASAAFENQDVPFERIVSALMPGGSRDASRNPLAQIMFAVHGQRNLGRIDLAGLDGELLGAPASTRFDLEVHLFQDEDRFAGHVLYSTDLFARETIDSITSTFREVLRQGLAQPLAPVATLPVMSQSAPLVPRSIISDQTDYPRDLSVVDVFLKQVTAHPEAIAVKDSSSQLTYLDLDQRSDRIAAHLRQRNLPVETVIGVYAGRSCRTIVAFLGILKASLAYLPLDVNVPDARTILVLSDLPEAHRIVLYGDVEAVPNFGLPGVEMIRIDDMMTNVAQVDDQSLVIKPNPSSIAYIIYTSGSTGVPKGVEVTHRGITRLVIRGNVAERLPSQAVVAHLSNIAFDASVWEVYSGILNGGTLICIDYWTTLNTAALGKVFKNEKINAAMISPALLKQCLTDMPDQIENLDLLFAAGDRFDSADAINAQRLVRGAVFNAYGPTENTVLSAIHHVKDEQYPNGVPIGRSVSNSAAFVMDPHQRLVPPGVMGELVVAGDGLARGYTNASQNAHRFVEVYIDNQLIRAYRTGDRVRQRPTDNLLEFFGRLDRQVKIRGHRVELAEVEQVIIDCDVVADVAVVLADGAVKDEPIMVAFLTTKEIAGIGHHTTHEQVSDWSEHFDANTYAEIKAISSADVGVDFLGWTSMYDGSAIERNEMREWLDDTIATILDATTLDGGKLPNVLEIGSGTGMILFNLGQNFDHYIGYDPSQSAVQFVHNALKSLPDLSGKVDVRLGTATDSLELNGFNPDIVILNSVVQYFPSPEYLFTIIQGLAKLPGVKRLFFGDIRSLAMNKQFLASRAIFELGDRVSKGDILRKMAEFEEREEELLVDPGFFTELTERIPQLVKHVEILPKAMQSTNELSAFRYGAVIHIGDAEEDIETSTRIYEEEWVNFAGTGMNRGSLINLLQTSVDKSILAIGNIPYSKTFMERSVVEALGDDDITQLPLDWLSKIRAATKHSSSLSRKDLNEIGQETGWCPSVSWARQHSQHGALDVVFQRYEMTDRGPGKQHALKPRFPTDHKFRSRDSLANRPIQRLQQRRATSQVREVLRSKLPPYMIPTRIVALSKLPITTNGKVDRRQLANRTQSLPMKKSRTVRTSPRNATEELVCEVISDILGVDVSIEDDFFHLGGHSLMATKLAGRINRRLSSQVSVRDIFDCPIVADLAQLIRSKRTAHDSDVSERYSAPFALLPYQDPQDFVDQEIASQLDLTNDKIMDVYPITRTQKTFIWHPVNERPRYPSLVFFDFKDSADVNRLKEACEALVQRFDILRTVFLRASGSFYQIVMQRSDVAIEVHEVADELESATRRLQDWDYRHPLSLGHSLLRIGILKAKDSTVRVVFRLSHALYDGLSFEHIISALHALYHQRPLPMPQKFARYVQHMIHSREQGYSFWRSTLENSRMALLEHVVSDEAQQRSNEFLHLNRTFDAPFPANEFGITQATVFTTACAMMLARLTNTDDVVFGRIISGRQSLPTSCQQIVGPCTNDVPVRVRIDKSLDLKSLLQRVQDQYVDSFPFETLGFDDIKANCTSWPDSVTNYGCTTTFQNFEIFPESQVSDHKIRMDSMESEYQKNDTWKQAPLYDMNVTGAPEPDGRSLTIYVGVNGKLCDSSVPDRMLTEMCKTMLELTAALQ